jgi:hypothetical protein
MVKIQAEPPVFSALAVLPFPGSPDRKRDTRSIACVLTLAADQPAGPNAKLPRAKPLSRRWHDTAAGLASGGICALARRVARGNPGHGHRRGPAGDGRSKQRFVAWPTERPDAPRAIG